MNYPDITERQVQRAEELVSWTRGERLRFLWYRPRLTVSEMNHATRRLLELQTRQPPTDQGHALARNSGLTSYTARRPAWRRVRCPAPASQRTVSAKVSRRGRGSTC